QSRARVFVVMQARIKRLGNNSQSNSGTYTEQTAVFSWPAKAVQPRQCPLGLLPSPPSPILEQGACLLYHLSRMLDLTLGCLKWAAVGFVVAFALMKLFEASHIHDDIPKPAFKIRQTKRATLVLSTFAAMLSALVWLLV